jgi:hypothetical protein
MPTTEPRRSLEESVQLGQEMYDRRVVPQLRPEDTDKFVAVDIPSGEFEADVDEYAAVKRLRTRLPSAEIFVARVGHLAAHKIRSGR